MRIAVISSYGYWGQLDPRLLWEEGAEERQIGGGETAMLNCASEWATQHGGNEVLLFCPCSPGHKYGIDFIPIDHFVPFITSLDVDVLVAWDFPHAFRFADRVKHRVLAFQLNHAEVGVFSSVIDEYWHPSNWHRDRFCKLWPEIPVRHAFGDMTNGVDVSRYERVAQTDVRADHRVIYTSSPDRGLHHLLRFWPRVRDAVPDAELHVYYDIKRWLESNFEGEKNGYVLPTLDRAKYIAMVVQDPPPGITFFGGVSQGSLAKAQIGASVLCYPCDPVAPTEGFSMTVLEGITAGCSVLTTNADAFPELWSGVPGVQILPLPVQDDVWVDALVKALQNGSPGRVTEFREHTWKSVGDRQLQHLRSLLNAAH